MPASQCRYRGGRRAVRWQYRRGRAMVWLRYRRGRSTRGAVLGVAAGGWASNSLGVSNIYILYAYLFFIRGVCISSLSRYIVWKAYVHTYILGWTLYLLDVAAGPWASNSPGALYIHMYVRVCMYIYYIKVYAYFFYIDTSFRLHVYISILWAAMLSPGCGSGRLSVIFSRCVKYIFLLYIPLFFFFFFISHVIQHTQKSRSQSENHCRRRGASSGQKTRGCIEGEEPCRRRYQRYMHILLSRCIVWKPYVHTYILGWTFSLLDLAAGA